MSDDVFRFLTDPNNLEAALDLQAVIEDVRGKVFDVFWDNVRRGCEERLTAADSTGWTIERAGSAAYRGSWLGFVGRDDPRANKYSLVFADIGGQEGKEGCPYFGVKQGSSADASNVPVIDRVRRTMGELGIGARDNGWPAYAYLSDIGIRISGTWDNDSVIRLNKDNQGEEHALAKQMAELLWKAFSACRQDLEVLNSSSA